MSLRDPSVTLIVFLFRALFKQSQAHLFAGESQIIRLLFCHLQLYIQLLTRCFHLDVLQYLQNNESPHELGWLISKQQQKITNAGENVEKIEPLCPVGGNLKWYSSYGKEGPQKN